jgi:hypothetical protein
MSFYVGQKVVCVDDSPRHSPHSLKIGAIYVIREVGDGPANAIHKPKGLWVKLLGVKVFHLKHGVDDWPLKATRFRPLDELKEEARKRQAKEILV